jgi:hypothetical protein
LRKTPALNELQWSDYVVYNEVQLLQQKLIRNNQIGKNYIQGGFDPMKNICATVTPVVYAQRWKVVLTALLFTALIQLIGFVPPASADIVVTYSLDNVTFADGGVATGTITEEYSSATTLWSLASFNVNVTDPSFPVQPLYFTPATGGSIQSPQVVTGSGVLGFGYILMYQGGFTTGDAALYLNIPSGDFQNGSAQPTGSITLVPGTDVGGTAPAPAQLFAEQVVGGFVNGLGGSLVPLPANIFQGSSTNSSNSTPQNPIILTSGGQFSGIAGDIGGTHTTDAYSFFWAGGNLSLTELFGPNLNALLYDAQGNLLDTIGTLGLNGSTPIDLSSGDYVLQLTGNSSDPPYEIISNEPIGGLSPVPEPAILLFLGPSLVGLAAIRRRLGK